MKPYLMAQITRKEFSKNENNKKQPERKKTMKNANFKTKLIALILLMCTLTIMFSSCETDVKIEKPEDTNLEYWLLDSPNMNDCTLIDCGNPLAEEFLAKGYVAIVDEKRNLIAPNEAVVYRIEMYPYRDLKQGTKRICQIRITDPDVYVWGLTINSSREEIIKTLEKVGYEIYQDSEKSITFTIEENWFVYIRYGERMSISHETYYLYHLEFDIPKYLFE